MIMLSLSVVWSRHVRTRTHVCSYAYTQHVPALHTVSQTCARAAQMTDLIFGSAALRRERRLPRTVSGQVVCRLQGQLALETFTCKKIYRKSTLRTSERGLSLTQALLASSGHALSKSEASRSRLLAPPNQAARQPQVSRASHQNLRRSHVKFADCLLKPCQGSYIDAWHGRERCDISSK